MKYSLYILKSQVVDRFYVGSTENVERRLSYHNTIEKGYTSRYRPWALVFKQEFENKALAQVAERKIKKWKSRKMIEKIIRGEIKL